MLIDSIELKKDINKLRMSNTTFIDKASNQTLEAVIRLIEVYEKVELKPAL